jgi:hypothetical protein
MFFLYTAMSLHLWPYMDFRAFVYLWHFDQLKSWLKFWNTFTTFYEALNWGKKMFYLFAEKLNWIGLMNNAEIA